MREDLGDMRDNQYDLHSLSWNRLADMTKRVGRSQEDLSCNHTESTESTRYARVSRLHSQYANKGTSLYQWISYILCPTQATAH